MPKVAEDCAPGSVPGSKIESPVPSPAIGQTAAATGNDTGQTMLGAGNSRNGEGTGDEIGVGTESGILGR